MYLLKIFKIIFSFKHYIGPAPFHFEEKAVQELEKCDYSIKITPEIAISGKS